MVELSIIKPICFRVKFDMVTWPDFLSCHWGDLNVIYLVFKGTDLAILFIGVHTDISEQE